MTTIKNVLIVEDETAHFELIERGFEKRKDEFHLQRAACLAEALYIIETYPPDIIISDWKLPDGVGTSLIFKDSRNHLKIPIILMTSFGNESFAVEAIKLGVLDYVVKSPEILADLPHLIDRTMREYSLICERIEIEDKVNKLSIAVAQSSVIVVITDTNGIIEYVNPMFEKVTGYSSGFAIGKNTSILKSGYSSTELYKSLWGTIKSGEQWRGEFVNKKSDGSLYWEDSSISPVFDTAGNITNYLKIGEDISLKKRMELDLKTALGKAEESNRLKTSILANMNHELRTPLMGILGMSQLLTEELIEISHKDMVARIQSSGKRLMNTLNSILDLSELESDPSWIQFSEHPISSNLEYLLDEYKQSALEKGLFFNIEIIEKNLFGIIYEKFFNQAILNIVDNAVKYTVSGGITITVDKEMIQDALWGKIFIADTGIGIEENHLGLIFQEFRQVSEGFSRNYEGSGLGLSIAKKMIEVMNGQLNVDSDLGKGTTFTVWFPAALGNYGSDDQTIQLKSEEVKIIDAKANISYVNVCVLYVEDNIINQEVTKMFLKNTAEIDCAQSGTTAIKMAQKKKYSIILMDINLSASRDGIEISNEIRKLPGYKDTPIIATTGFASNADREKFKAHGLNGVLVKPFTKEDLIQTINDFH